MNYAATYEGYGQPSLSSQLTFPVAPFLKKYVHSVFDDLQQARQAVQALHDAGYDARSVHLMQGQEFVAAVEQRHQQQSRLLETLMRFFSSTDDGFFGDVYLQEARRGHHILAVHLPRAEHVLHVRDLLVPYQARLIKYVGTWAVTDLPSRS